MFKEPVKMQELTLCLTPGCETSSRTIKVQVKSFHLAQLVRMAWLQMTSA